jgi:hypothetical protein
VGGSADGQFVELRLVSLDANLIEADVWVVQVLDEEQYVRQIAARDFVRRVDEKDLTSLGG